MSTPQYPISIAAVAIVTGATAVLQSGSLAITSAVRNGAGDWTITLAEAIDRTQMAYACTVDGATTCEVAVERVSDGVLRVRALSNAGAATDVDFCLVVWRTLGS